MLCDFSRYILASKQAQTATSIHLSFASDQETLRFSLRIDGMPIDPAPVVPLYGTDSTSPFVAIATRS
jgi:hypothetical protein